MRSGDKRAIGIWLVAIAVLVLISVAPQLHAQGDRRPAVRAITAFVRLDPSAPDAEIREALIFLNNAKSQFERAGYSVETIRITTQPFLQIIAGLSDAQVRPLFHKLNEIAQREGVLFSVGPAMMTEDDAPENAQRLARVLADNDQLNGSITVAAEDGIHWKSGTAAAHIMKYLAEHTAHSAGNFQFAAAALVPAYGPFFPASYHNGTGHQFSIGFASAAIVQKALAEHPGRVAEAEESLGKELSHYYAPAERIASGIAAHTGWNYAGTDPTPAPEGDASIGDAIEHFTGAKFGSSGTLTAAALITRAVKSVPIKQVGYSGLMVSVLEDNVLAKRWSEGTYNIDSLLSYSAVCGTGLDTVPLPGDVSEQQLARIIGDVATLAYKWKKPLSVRLLPVARKKPGEKTDFNNPHLTDALLPKLP